VYLRVVSLVIVRGGGNGFSENTDLCTDAVAGVEDGVMKDFR